MTYSLSRAVKKLIYLFLFFICCRYCETRQWHEKKRIKDFAWIFIDSKGRRDLSSTFERRYLVRRLSNH